MSHKYRATAVEHDGLKFPSKREANRWIILRTLESQGQITGLERQVRIPLEGQDGPLRSQSGRRLFYVCDFRYTWDGEVIWEDAKGYPTPEYKLKRSILSAMGIRITES